MMQVSSLLSLHKKQSLKEREAMILSGKRLNGQGAAGRELARRITGTGTLTSSKLDKQLLHFLSLMALAFYKVVTGISFS